MFWATRPECKCLLVRLWARLPDDLLITFTRRVTAKHLNSRSPIAKQKQRDFLNHMGTITSITSKTLEELYAYKKTNKKTSKNIYYQWRKYQKMTKMLVSSLLGTVGIPVKIHPVLNFHAELFGFGEGVGAVRTFVFGDDVRHSGL